MIRRLFYTALVVLSLHNPSPVAAAPSAQLIDSYWQQAAKAGTSVDHSAYAAFLNQRVARGTDGIVRVDYAGVSAEQKATLKRYISGLTDLDPTSLGRAEQMAYWINLYNAATIDLVLDHYPVASIRKIMGGLFNTGPWDNKILSVAGQQLSLNDIEHGILRPIWKDPRIHYAVNCASLGCPDLADEPYDAARLDAQLDAAARAYVNHPRGARLEGGRLYVSSIYDWYAVDFGGNDAGVIAHLRRYAAPDLADQLAKITRIAGDAYDWQLNHQ